MQELIVRSREDKTYRIIAEQDDWAESPDDWGDEDIFLSETKNRNCTIGRRSLSAEEAGRKYCEWGEGPYNMDHLDCGKDAAEILQMQEDYDFYHQSGFMVFPVSLLDYGSNGCQLRYWYPGRYNGEPDGYLVVKWPESPLEQLAELAEWDKLPDERADMMMKEWNTYLSGEVYVVRITEVEWDEEEGNWADKDGGHNECCGGIYDDWEDWVKDNIGEYTEIPRPPRR